MTGEWRGMSGSLMWVEDGGRHKLVDHAGWAAIVLSESETGWSASFYASIFDIADPKLHRTEFGSVSESQAKQIAVDRMIASCNSILSEFYANARHAGQ
jgi:hypothetical protein